MLKAIKSTLFIFLFAFIVNCNLYSGTTFIITVLDSKDNPVQNAEIVANCGNGKIEGKTDENGKFSTIAQCVFDEGIYFTVKKDGYLEHNEDYGVTYLFQYNQFKDKKVILNLK